MNNLSPLVLVDRLVAAGVPLVIIGGHAVNFHGYVRATEDVDILFQRSRLSEAALADVLQMAEAFWISNEIDPKTGIEKTVPVTLDYVQRTHLMMLGSNHGYIDIFDFIPGHADTSLADLFATAERADNRPFVSLEWLRRMKLASDRPQDRIDLDHLP